MESTLSNQPHHLDSFISDDFIDWNIYLADSSNTAPVPLEPPYTPSELEKLEFSPQQWLDLTSAVEELQQLQSTVTPTPEPETPPKPPLPVTTPISPASPPASPVISISSTEEEEFPIATIVTDSPWSPSPAEHLSMTNAVMYNVIMDIEKSLQLVSEVTARSVEELRRLKQQISTE